VSWRYLIGVQEILGWCPGYNSLFSLSFFDWCPVEIDWCPGDIYLASWRYFIGVLEIFDLCPEDI